MADNTVLIIDDNPDNVMLIQILLECEGIDVRTAEHALEAMEVLKTCLPALILMDIQLPGMDGLELTRHLRRDPRFDAVTIVALTAYAMKKDEEDARNSGCDGYLTKPIDTRTFPSVVRRYLDTPRAALTFSREA